MKKIIIAIADFFGLLEPLPFNTEVDMHKHIEVAHRNLDYCNYEFEVEAVMRWVDRNISDRYTDALAVYHIALIVAHADRVRKQIRENYFNTIYNTVFNGLQTN